MHTPKIGHKGIGWVGHQVMQYLTETLGYQLGVDYFPYDIDKGKEYNYDYNQGDWIIISVPSPRNADGSCDTSIVEESLRDIGSGKVVVIKSTVIPGTIERLQKDHPDKLLLFNPEFLTETQAKRDFFYPDMQIVGFTDTSKSVASMVLSLLPDAFFTSPGMKDCYESTSVTATEAELGKYGCNIFGALKVSFANIIADTCEAITLLFQAEGIEGRVDYERVRLVLGHDKRIKDSWLNISQGNYRGFGGYCFPKDLEAFIAFLQILPRYISDPAFRDCVEKGTVVLQAVWEYNKALLTRQGLTIEEVAHHIDRVQAQLQKNGAH